MVGSVNGGFQQQAPITNTFKPGEQSNGLSKVAAQDTLAKSNDAPNPNQPEKLTPVERSAQKEAKTAFSESTPKISAENISSSVNRGHNLDITV